MRLEGTEIEEMMDGYRAGEVALGASIVATTTETSIDVEIVR